jgi:phage baseplate assembly protein W
MVTRNTRIFSDISLGFGTNPATADVVQVTNEDAVKSSIRNLISTKNFERPFHPEIGCQLHSLLFENFTPVTIEMAKRMVADVLRAYEPRANILDIRVADSQDNNELVITVIFTLINSDRPVTVTTILDKAR